MTQAARAAPPPELVALYREHLAFVWRSAQRLGAPAHLLEDVAQDVFLVAARRLGDFRGESSIKTWLFGITLRVIREYRRSHFRHLRRVEALAEAPPASPADPYARQDATAMLLKLLSGLDDDRRTVFILAELEGFTAPEIAEGLHINLNTVYSRLRSARALLERELKRMGAA